METGLPEEGGGEGDRYRLCQQVMEVRLQTESHSSYMSALRRVKEAGRSARVNMGDATHRRERV